MEHVTISFGITDGERKEVASILCEAFSRKFERVFGSQSKSFAVIRKYLNTSNILVARKQGKIVGTAGVKYGSVNWLTMSVANAFKEFGLSLLRVAVTGLPLMARNSKKTLLIDILAVSAKARGKGIGTKMLCHLVSFARTKGLNKIRLYVVNTNERAKLLYEKMGFRVTKIHRLLWPWKSIFGLRWSYEMELSIFQHNNGIC